MTPRVLALALALAAAVGAGGLACKKGEDAPDADTRSGLEKVQRRAEQATGEVLVMTAIPDVPGSGCRGVCKRLEQCRSGPWVGDTAACVDACAPDDDEVGEGEAGALRCAATARTCPDVDRCVKDLR